PTLFRARERGQMTCERKNLALIHLQLAIIDEAVDELSLRIPGMAGRQVDIVDDDLLGHMISRRTVGIDLHVDDGSAAVPTDMQVLRQIAMIAWCGTIRMALQQVTEIQSVLAMG